MTLLLTMLPLYIFGNLHCFGMCGPLVMMIGKHEYRYFYFLGRLCSFSLAGLIAGELGAVLQIFLHPYHLSAITSFFFGGVIVIASLTTLLGWHYPGYHVLSKYLAQFNQSLSVLMLKDRAWPTFLFGFFTLMLPCGQTLIVFSACALSGDLWIGLMNGFVFALLTTPSLFLAMCMHRLFFNLKNYYNLLIGCCGLLIGILAIFRGLAEMEMIPHLVLNPESKNVYHLVIY